jgi:hypothetical protein
MGRWLDASAEAMKPIYERMHEFILESRVVEADESPVLFIDKKRELKKGKTGYVWVLYGDAAHPYSYFDFQPDRCAERAKKILKYFLRMDMVATSGTSVCGVQVATCTIGGISKKR